MKFFEKKTRYQIAKEAGETSLQRMDRVMEPYKRIATVVVLIGGLVLYVLNKTTDDSVPLDKKDAQTTLPAYTPTSSTKEKIFEYLPSAQNSETDSTEFLGPVFPEE